MIRVFYNRITRRYEVLNLIGPERRLTEILEWLREHRGLIPIEEHILRLPMRIINA